MTTVVKRATRQPLELPQRDTATTSEGALPAGQMPTPTPTPNPTPPANTAKSPTLSLPRNASAMPAERKFGS